MNTTQFSRLFPLGTHLCREPMPPMRELKRDMEIVKAKGFNMIKLQENWMIDEPREGQIDLGKYEELIDYAARLDLSVYLGLTCEQAPGWLYEKYPDGRMVRKDGLPVACQAQTTLPADGKPGPCHDHPGVMADELRFITSLVRILGRYENLAVWNTWQEIGYWSESLAGGQVCYCPHTIAAYQKWLARTYGDIAALNEHWNCRYADFMDVQPERCAGPVAQYFTYQYFMENVQIADILEKRRAAIKIADPLKRPVFAHKSSPALASGADWVYARAQDFLGVSNYPAWGNGFSWDDHRQSFRIPRHEGLLTELWDNLAYRTDHVRSANPPGAPVWAAEFQGGRVSTDLYPGRVPTKRDMERWMLTALGAGATAFSFWATRAEIMAPETNGFSLLDSEGNTTRRFEAVAALGAALNRHADLFARNTRPQAQVAILIDEWNYQLLSAMRFAPEVLKYEQRGWYRHLWERGIPCDFVNASELDEPRMANYKALIVPFAHSMADDVARSVLRFAHRGGRVLLTCAPGMINEAGYAPRGMMNPVLRNALGVSVSEYSLVEEPGDAPRYSQPQRTCGEYEGAGMMSGCGAFEGLAMRASVIIVTYQAREDQVLMTWNNAPCAVRNAWGTGEVILLGSCVGFSATAYRDRETASAVDALLARLGVRPEHEGKLLVTRRVSEREEAWVITNPHQESMAEEFDFPGEALLVEDGEELPIGQGRVTLALEPLDVRLVIIKKG